MVPLDQLEEGAKGEIAEIISGHGKHHHPHHDKKLRMKHHHLHHHDHHREPHCSRITDMGIRVGKTIELLKGGKQGPFLIKVDESRIAVGRKMAERIMIKSDS